MAFRRPTRNEDREYFKLKNYRGELAAFKVNDEDETYVNPNFEGDKPRPTVWADVTILTGDGAGKFFGNAEIGGKYIHEALAPATGTGDLVLGRINKGRRAYFLDDPGDEDYELAERFFEQDTAKVPASDEPEDDDEDDIPF